MTPDHRHDLLFYLPDIFFIFFDFRPGYTNNCICLVCRVHVPALFDSTLKTGFLTNESFTECKQLFKYQDILIQWFSGLQAFALFLAVPANTESIGLIALTPGHAHRLLDLKARYPAISY